MADETKATSPFPPWLRDLVYFGGILVAIVIFGQNLRSDQRSTKETLDRMVSDLSKVQSDVSAMQRSLPNPETLDLRFGIIEDKLKELQAEIDFEAAKSTKLREDLAAKGWKN